MSISLLISLLLIWALIAWQDVRTHHVFLWLLIANVGFGVVYGIYVLERPVIDLGLGGFISYGLGDLVFRGGIAYARSQRSRLALDVPTPFGRADVWVLGALGATFGVLGGLQACLLGLLIGGIWALIKWQVASTRTARWQITFAYTPSLLLAGCITLWLGTGLIELLLRGF